MAADSDKKSLKELIAQLHVKQLEVVAKYDLIEPSCSNDEFSSSVGGINDSFTQATRRFSRASSVDSGFNDCMSMTESCISTATQLASTAEETDELDDFEKLRCPSRSIEDVSRRKRKTQEVQLFPGLCLAQSVFQTATIMKFQIIGNELSNIRRVQCKQAEAEVAALNRRIQLLEEDLEKAEERLKVATDKLQEASKIADESERARRTLENRIDADDSRCSKLEVKLREAQALLQETENKYEEVARKLVMTEASLEKAEERAVVAERKALELESELRVIGNNLKSKEVNEEKSQKREDSYEGQIQQLTQRVKEAESRAELAERSVHKLQKEVDRLEDDLSSERHRLKLMEDEMEKTLSELGNL